MKLYIADVRILEDETVCQRLSHLLSEDRKKQIERLRQDADKRRCIGAGLLLEYGLQKHGYTLLTNVADKQSVTIKKGEHGKPFLSEISNLHFNLSHAGEYVVAVFANCEIGVDLERVRKANGAVIKRFFVEKERQYLQEVLALHGEGEIFDRAFTKLWTRKESYVKAVGEGLHLPLTDFCVLSDCVEEDKAYYLNTWDIFNEYILSICRKDNAKTELRKIDLIKAFDGLM